MRPVTLFTGQWADLPLAVLAEKAARWGYDGLELACWGDHFDVVQALENDGYIRQKRELLERYKLQCFAISNHLVGQCMCDAIIDERHKGMIPARIWGDGKPEGVRQRAAEDMKNAARASALFGPKLVIGFTGSPIWHMLAGFPPCSDEMIEAGYAEFAVRMNPVLDVFDEVGARFALEVHPGEIAFDFWTTKETLQAVNHRRTFGINFDPSHLFWQMVNVVAFIHEFGQSIFHVHVKDAGLLLDGFNGILSSLLKFGNRRRGWNFLSPGRGGVPFEKVFRALNVVGYPGPLSVEWEDMGMHRDQGTPEALAMVRRLDLIPSDVDFDAAFRTEEAAE
jgi:sugar phosphate isomerase/epimerase